MATYSVIIINHDHADTIEKQSQEVIQSLADFMRNPHGQLGRETALELKIRGLQVIHTELVGGPFEAIHRANSIMKERR